MIDTAQIVLLVVVVTLTGILVALGVQVFLILRELRRTVMKANKVLDDTGQITESVSRPISSFSSILTSLKTGASLVQMFTGKKKLIKRIADEIQED